MSQFRDALSIWTTDETYKDYRSEVVGWRLVPADENGKLRVYYRETGEPYAMLTYCFLTEDEAKSMDWWGDEAFSRKSGDQLWVIDMIARGGKDDVLAVSKDIRKFFYETYPEFETVYAMRGNGSRRGWYPNKGLNT